MISQNRLRHISLVIGFLLVLLTAMCFQFKPVLADVPAVVNIESWTSGSNTILNITVRHSSPTSSHYVNIVEIDIDGTVETVNLSSQSSATFVVQYNMGGEIDMPEVIARAHCTLHGWSNWSEPVVIPEFSPIYLLLILTMGSLLILLLKFKLQIPKRVL